MVVKKSFLYKKNVKHMLQLKKMISNISVLKTI